MAFQFGFDSGDGGQTSFRSEAVSRVEAPTEGIRPVQEHNLKELVCFALFPSLISPCHGLL